MKRLGTTILARLIAPLLFAAALAALCAPSAQAAFGLSDIGLSFRQVDGSLATQAGSHPAEMSTSIGVTTRVEPNGDEVPEGEAKDVLIEFPPGFAGDPKAVPVCSMADFINREKGRSGCPDASTLGIAALKLAADAIPAGAGDIFIHVPVYNLAAGPRHVSKLGFIALDVPVTVDVGLTRAEPYRVFATSTNIVQALLFYDSEITVWGNPASSAHDPLRGQCLSKEPTELTEEPVSRGVCSVNIPAEPFLTMPRSCTGPLETLFSISSWQDPATTVSGAALTEDESTPPKPVGTSGCSDLGFRPEISARPTTLAAESPTGLDFDLTIADEGIGSTTGTAGADLSRVRVTLPEGITANPSSAEGLEFCTEAQLAAEGTGAGTGCPDASKLGTVATTTPLLTETLRGSLFLAEPYRNRFGTLLALYVVIEDARLGILVKQAGTVEPDPRTGQLVTVFDDLPQVPLSSISLRFREGARSPLVSPPTCGTHEVKALLHPSSGMAPASSSSLFQISTGPGGGACPTGNPPFSPGFSAGTQSNSAGSYSPFVMRLTRRDGDQDLTKFSARLPLGMVAKLAGVARCSDEAIEAAKGRSGREEQASPSCPADSQIGRVLAGAGVGSLLTYVPGSIYLAGPYNGAPLSVAAVVPAVAGPFDVGTVVTRLALRIDPRSAEVTVDGGASDPIPHILAGIPLKVRDIRAYVDRPEFTLNPTSCDPAEVGATLWGGGLDPFSLADDFPTSLAERFQAANCASLGFRPRLDLKLIGGTKRGQFPALRGTYVPRPGDANLEGLVLRLPSTAFLEQGHIRTICTRVQFAAKVCPAAAVYGTAKAWTPILDAPLEGHVYLRSSSNPLPDFVADLRGLVDVEAVARIDSKNGGIRATFTEVPDAPLSKVVVNMQGGRKGLIVNSTNLCARKSRANAVFTGQNGKRLRAKPVLKPRCKGRGK